MFKKDLLDKFERIFDLKVRFEEPGDSQEQEVLFVHIQRDRTNVKDGQVTSRVEGQAICFANGDKLPFGYFAKKIRNANVTDTKDLFFFDMDENTKVFQNIIRISFDFIYFFNSQYDPNVGSIESIEIAEG